LLENMGGISSKNPRRGGELKGELGKSVLERRRCRQPTHAPRNVLRGFKLGAAPDPNTDEAKPFCDAGKELVTMAV